MSFTLQAILFFLATSIFLYVLLGGADFGAGILELFLGRKKVEEQRKLITHAMAPVWEANHMWLILAVVILFMGFPKIYSLLSVHLHIPLVAMLIGIVARGCAFTFRHYDTLTRDYYRIYSWFFAFSSLWTSVFLGIIAGSLILGRIDPHATDFHALYIAPWFNTFCLAMGLFTASLFAFLAAVYLIGETHSPDLRRAFTRKAGVANAVLVIAGALVFITAESSGQPLLRKFLATPLSLSCFAFATLLLFPFWRALLRGGSSIALRSLGAAIVGLVILGWYAVQYPVAVHTPGGVPYTFETTAAPEPTLQALFGALVFGSLLIFPSLIYLMKVFKWETFEKD